MNKGVIGAFSAVVGAMAGAVGMSGFLGNKVTQKQQLSDKHLALFLMMNQWVKVKQEGKNLQSYFEKKGYHKIAIYGMSYVGETLVEELKNSSIEVKYGIDQSADRIYAEFDVVLPEDELENVDAVVVTPITFFDEIANKLSKKIDCPIVSLEDILYEV